MAQFTAHSDVLYRRTLSVLQGRPRYQLLQADLALARKRLHDRGWGDAVQRYPDRSKRPRLLRLRPGRVQTVSTFVLRADERRESRSSGVSPVGELVAVWMGHRLGELSGWAGER